MHSWRVRQVRISVPGDVPQWCIDNGEDDLGITRKPLP